MNPTEQTPIPADSPGPQGALSSKAKLLLGLTALLAAVLVVLVLNDKQKNEEASLLTPSQLATNRPAGSQTATDQAEVKETPLPELLPVVKTGNANAVVDGIVADYAADANLAAEGDADADYISQSAALINPEGVYDANQF